MQPKATLLLGLALALAAGTAIFFVLDRPGAAPRSSASASAARPGQSGEGPPADLAAAQSIVETDAGAGRVAASTARSVALGKEAVRAAAGEVRADALYGRVLGGFGAPVAGAEVEIEGIGDTADGLLQVLGGSTDQETVTGPDGTFRTGWPARWEEVNVKIKARGYLPFEQPQDLLDVEGDQNLGVFELSPGVVLGGRVVDAAGQPIPGAEVRRVEESQELNFGMRFNREGVIETDADGRFLLPNEEPGPYVLLVEHPSYPHGRFTGDTPPAGGEDTGLVLSLAHAASVAGKIEGFPGDREHVRVSAMLRDPGAGSESVMADMMEDAGFGAEGLESAVAPDGAFKIDGLEAGKAYSIRAYARGGFFGRDACSDERVVVAGTGDARLTWKPGGALAFRVVDAATRNPLDGVEVRFRWERDGGNGFPDGTRTRKFAAGQVLLDDLRPKGGQTTLSRSR
jgi:protocatechuate 3,4-dioxygenase beta subunit